MAKSSYVFFIVHESFYADHVLIKEQLILNQTQVLLSNF